MTLFLNACVFLFKVLTLPLYLAELVGLLSFYKRVFPRFLYNFTLAYNETMKEKKRELFRNLDKFFPPKGSLRILELGCGSGANFEHYPTGCRITCIDPNPHFQKYLEKSMAKNDHLVYGSFIVASGENLKAVEDNSVDVVVCTLVLCSVKDTQKVLQEAKRVLRPGGALFFLEHVVSDPSSWIYFFNMFFSLSGTILTMAVIQPALLGSTLRQLASLTFSYATSKLLYFLCSNHTLLVMRSNDEYEFCRKKHLLKAFSSIFSFSKPDSFHYGLLNVCMKEQFVLNL
ncbi:hypothetical protein G5714_007144 [Onychostoma macrolepis]|uniref:Methyltransferase type 11 domain-containing protein n=1 Tax=Onychostoma macrolepis TaxID=369639 RepID=A0A7J6CZI5_9TELE|nr:hypothetical protein G5714_007144 [Onychostoma macrolepis]